MKSRERQSPRSGKSLTQPTDVGGAIADPGNVVSFGGFGSPWGNYVSNPFCVLLLRVACPHAPGSHASPVLRGMFVQELSAALSHGFDVFSSAPAR